MTGGGFEKMKRMIEIVNHLSYGEVLSSSELGRLCGVSRKTIKEDINDLTSLYPIESKAGKNGGYCLSADYLREHRFLTSEQAVFLDKKIEESEGYEKEMFVGIKDRFTIKRL